MKLLHGFVKQPLVRSPRHLSTEMASEMVFS